MTPAEFVAALWEADGDAEKIMRLYERSQREAEARGLERAAGIAEDDNGLAPDGASEYGPNVSLRIAAAIRAEKERT